MVIQATDKKANSWWPVAGTISSIPFCRKSVRVCQLCAAGQLKQHTGKLCTCFFCRMEYQWMWLPVGQSRQIQSLSDVCAIPSACPLILTTMHSRTCSLLKTVLSFAFQTSTLTHPTALLDAIPDAASLRLGESYKGWVTWTIWCKACLQHQITYQWKCFSYILCFYKLFWAALNYIRKITL